MINWNNNDTKYIIKRIILYLLISGIVFCVGTQCAKANTVSERLWSDNTIMQFTANNPANHYSLGGTFFVNQGNGEIVWTLVFAYPQTQAPVGPVSAITIGNDNEEFACDIGSTTYYYNNGQTFLTLTNRCKVTLANGRGIKYASIYMISGYATGIATPAKVWSFTSDSNTASDIVNAETQNTNAIIAANTSNTTNLANQIANSGRDTQYAINSASSQAHQDAQNIISGLQQATATEQATQDYLKEDYQFDQQMINDFSIFGTNTNYLQQILMWPYNLALTLGSALSGTTCSTYSFGYLYGTELKLPCINWKQYVGNTIYVAIDTIMGMCLLFGVISFIRKAFEYVLNFGNSAYETISVEVFK